MALAFDAASTSKTSGATSLTWSHTCTGSERLLIVGVSFDGTGNVSSITYAGTALTSIGTINNSGNNRSVLYGLRNPASGANNIVVTPLASVGMVGGATSWTGADQTTAWRTGSTATGSTTTPTVNVTSATGEVVVDVATHGVDASGNPTSTVGAGQTQRWNDANTNQIRGYGSQENGAATVTMSWSTSVSDFWSIVAAPLIASAGAAVTPQHTTVVVGQAVPRAAFV